MGILYLKPGTQMGIVNWGYQDKDPRTGSGGGGGFPLDIDARMSQWEGSAMESLRVNLYKHSKGGRGQIHYLLLSGCRPWILEKRHSGLPGALVRMPSSIISFSKTKKTNKQTNKASINLQY